MADVTVEVSSGSVTLVGQDTGVRAILSEGAGGVEIAAALVDRGAGNLRVALVTGGGFSQGVPLDWTNEQTFRLQRNIDPARRAVLTVSCHPPEILTDADLPPAPTPEHELRVRLLQRSGECRLVLGTDRGRDHAFRCLRP